MNKIKSWIVGALLTIGGLFGYHSTIPNTSVIEVETSVSPSPTPSGTPISQLQRIQIDCDETCTAEEKALLPAIVAKVEETEAGDCFRNKLLDNSTGIDQTQSNGFTAFQAYTIVVNSKVSSTLTYYYQLRNWFTKTIVVGFENGDGEIHANRAAWNEMSLCEKAENVGHEISHGDPMNFTHDFKNTSRRPRSVPYVISDAIEACCK